MVNCYYMTVCIYYTDFQVLRVERVDGSEITDWDSKPPDTVYVVGVKETTH